MTLNGASPSRTEDAVAENPAFGAATEFILKYAILDLPFV